MTPMAGADPGGCGNAPPGPRRHPTFAGSGYTLATTTATAPFVIYPTMVAKLVDILSRIPAIDAEVSRINGSAPPGVKDRLLKVSSKLAASRALE